MIDILTLLYLGEISEDEAYDKLDEINELFHSNKTDLDWLQLGNFSHYEATASLHAAPLMTIAKFRFEGWPTECNRCGLPLDYRIFGWTYVENKGKLPLLRHIECPSVPKKL